MINTHNVLIPSAGVEASVANATDTPPGVMMMMWLNAIIRHSRRIPLDTIFG